MNNKHENYTLYFRDIFNEYRRNLHSYFANGITPLLWTFHPNIIFNRTDLFVRRLHIIEVYLFIIIQVGNQVNYMVNLYLYLYD